MLVVGDLAPDFTLPDEEGNPVSLSSLLSGGPVLLYFYPADFSPVCTMQACGIRDRHEDIANAGVRVVGISPQGGASHRAFKRMFSLPFPLLHDDAREVIRAFGVQGMLGIRRATFLIGEDRRIRERVVADLMLGEHMQLVQHALERPRDG